VIKYGGRADVEEREEKAQNFNFKTMSFYSGRCRESMAVG
jgi:hypothetical protein